MSVRESQIEDVLATYPGIAARILGMRDDLRLLARQMPVSSGRIDLLFSSGNSLTLVELKVVTAASGHVQQLVGYLNDVHQMQKDGHLVDARVTAVLLCPSFPTSVEQTCLTAGLRPLTYSTADVLESFFKELRALSAFITTRPSDHGIWNIHLINRALVELPRQRTLKELARAIFLSPRSVSNHLRFAQELRLVQRSGRFYELTVLGEEFVKYADSQAPAEELSEKQAQCLREFIVRDPFASATVFGIYSMVDAVFTLARNVYPVPKDLAMNFFRDASGKLFEWSSQITAYHGLRMYSNYAADLGLLGTYGQDLYLTPDGLRFILLLQLHKSIKMVDLLHLQEGRSI